MGRKKPTTTRHVYLPRVSQRRTKHVSTLVELLDASLHRQEWCAAAAVATLLLRASSKDGEAEAKAIAAALECARRGRKEVANVLLRLMRQRKQWKAVERAYVEEATARIMESQHKRAVSLLDESFDFRSAYSRQRIHVREESLVFDYVCYAMQGIASYLAWVRAVRLENPRGRSTHSRLQKLGKSCHRILMVQQEPESAQGIEEKETALGFLHKALDLNPKANLLALLHAQLCVCSDDGERGIKEIKALMEHGNETPHLHRIGAVVLEASIYESGRRAMHIASTTTSSDSDTTHDGHSRAPHHSEQGSRLHGTDEHPTMDEEIPEHWSHTAASKLKMLKECYTRALEASPGCHATCRRLLLLLRFLKGENIQSYMDEIDALANHLDFCTHCLWGWEKMVNLLFEHAALPSSPGWSHLCSGAWSDRLLIWKDYHFSTLSFLSKDGFVASHEAEFIRCFGAKVVCASFFYGRDFVDHMHPRDRMRRWDTESVKQVNKDIARARAVRSQYLENLFPDDRPCFVTRPHELPKSFMKVFPQHRRLIRERRHSRVGDGHE